MNLLKPIIVTAITIFLLAWALPTVSYLDWSTLLIAAIVLTVLQKIIRPILSILFLPINIVTLGIFSIFINVGLLWLATYLVPGFAILPMTILGVGLSYFLSLVLISFLIGLIQNIVDFVI